MSDSDKVALAQEKQRKIEKKLGSNVATELRALSTDKIRDMIINLSNEMADNEALKKDDVVRSRLMEDLKAINDGYGDIKKDKVLRVQYLLATLTDRGL